MKLKIKLVCEFCYGKLKKVTKEYIGKDYKKYRKCKDCGALFKLSKNLY